MDDDKLAKEYLEFVKAVNSDWTIPDKEDDIGGDDAFTGAYKQERCHTARERKRRGNAAKMVCGDGVSNVRRKK